MTPDKKIIKKKGRKEKEGGAGERRVSIKSAE
jgi:hypothetical protein